MSAKHTPGPWASYTLSISADSGYESSTEGRCTADQYGIAIAALHGETPTSLDLIAAAPDLLQALQAIVKSLADQDDEGMIEHAQPMIAARAAIAKATGEQHE
jgi:hypothetical protein